MFYAWRYMQVLTRVVRRPDLLKGIFSMGFDKPSKIQEKALPLLLADPLVDFNLSKYLTETFISPTNMIGQSQSGTGKTAAFVLTMLSRVDYDLHKPQVCQIVFLY